MFDIESIRAMFAGHAVKYTQHFKVRIKERSIKLSEIKTVLMSGKVIEQIPDDQPIPSVLIFGYTNSNEPLHVAVGVDDDILWLITAYVPSLDVWEDDYKTRKDVNR